MEKIEEVSACRPVTGSYIYGRNSLNKTIYMVANTRTDILERSWTSLVVAVDF